MKIVIVDGPDKGRETELREPFISIGRETDNDIVLDDQQASRYHAKIEKDGTVWVVKDLGSSNGIRLNGMKISQSAPLSPGDEVLVGETKFNLVAADGEDVGGVAIGSPAEAKKESATAAADTPAASGNAQKRTRLILVAVLTLLVVVVIAILLPTPQKGKKTVTPKDPFEEIKDKPLQVYLYKERSGRELENHPYNIFVYELTIKDRSMTVTVRDLVDKLHQEQTVDLTVEEEDKLKKVLLTDQFLEATGRTREKPEFVERVKLVAMAGRRGNSVEYLNETETIPEPVKAVMRELEDLVGQKTKVNQLPRSVAFAQAEKLFISGNKLYMEKDVYPENLYNSRKSLDECKKYLEGYDDPPEFYEEMVRRQKQVDEELKKLIEDLKASARFQERTDLLKAKDTYQEIMDRLPDDRHPDYIYAKDKIFSINRQLRKLKR